MQSQVLENSIMATSDIICSTACSAVLTWDSKK